MSEGTFSYVAADEKTLRIPYTIKVCPRNKCQLLEISKN